MNRLVQLAACVLLVVGFAALGGCGGPPKTNDNSLVQIEYPALLKLLDHPKQTTLIVDVRSAAKFKDGHIPGAINIPIEKLVWQDPRLMNVDNIVVYASGWTDYLSPAAAKKLLFVGYPSVFDFRGGIDLWTTYGGKLEKGESAP